MSTTVRLSKKHGEYEIGTEFSVHKAGPSTTIVESPEGRRIILPNSKLEGPADEITSVVEVSPNQVRVITRLKDGDDVDEILDEYIEESGMEEQDAKKDMVFLETMLSKKATFQPVDKDGSPLTTPGAMSDTERAVLEGLLDGNDDMWKADELGVTVTPEPEMAEPELGPNQVWFTDITNGRLPESGINHVITQYPEEHFPSDMRIDIPRVSKEHYWDCEVLEALVMCHKLREKGLITGMPGTGKSSSVQQFAAWIRQPYMRLGGRGDLEAASFLGSSWADIEETESGAVTKLVFKAGMLTQGLNYDGFGYLVTIDEVWKIPAYIQMCMQHLYEKDGYLTIDDKPGTKADKIINPAPEFLMILTDNVKGTGDNFDKFAATQMQDTSSLDRISIIETLNYLQPKDEEEMLRNRFPREDKALIRKLVKFAGLVRNGYKSGSIALTLSPRGLIAILDMINEGLPLHRAIDLAFYNKLADETEQIAVRDMKKTVGF